MRFTLNHNVGKIVFIVILLLYSCPNSLSAAQINLAHYRIVRHSSSIDVNQCGHLVVDGSLDSYWESQPGGRQWLTISLGERHHIDEIVIHWGENYAVNFSVFTLMNDQDGENKIHTEINGIGGISRINCNATASLIKLDITKVKNEIRGCVIKEVEIMGAGQERFLPSKPTSLSLQDLSLNGNNWRVQNASFVADEPGMVSSLEFSDKDWIPAKVPGTVLGSYYDFGAFPDPLYGDNMHQISDAFFSGNDYWYRTVVNLQQVPDGNNMFLNFSGINWKSDVYFNSKHLGRIDGAFQRAQFDVTDLLSSSGSNVVAVYIHHLDNWVSGNNKVIRKYLGARTTNGDMTGLDSPTFMSASGWNWLPIIKGRNLGIWNDVTFEIAGKVTIRDPWVSSLLPLGDTTTARLSISTELHNNTNTGCDGTLIARFGNIVIEHPVAINPHETKTITLNDSQYPQLTIENPKLWWPNGYGQQNLQKLTLQFIDKGRTTDTRTINFGIRQIDTKVIDNVLFLYCNGYRILLRGGNWGLPEAMLRCDSAGYDLRVLLHKEANFNIIRNWVGQTGHEAFYDACDKYGILVWDDFWLANPVDGPDPKDTLMFMNNVRDKIKWVRKHPSLALYCGRNEGLPPLPLDMAMSRETMELDGSRLYIPHSADGNVTGLGPYDIRNPKWYFANRGITLHSEQGIIAFPEKESMVKMMPVQYLWPINNMWAIHDYQFGRSDRFTDSISARFGQPTSLEDYCRRAQMLNYESAKSIFECLQSNQGSGIILWMSQAAWPSMICQLYDHYFEYTASYFAAKKAASNIHVFWDNLKNDILVSNNTISDIRNAKVIASIYNANGEKLWEKTSITDMTAGSAKSCFKLEKKPNKSVIYLKLVLEVNGNIVADNFYWLENEKGNCLDLNDLPLTTVSAQVKRKSVNGYYTAEITLLNESSAISLLNKIKVKDKNTGESILPVFFDDDYVSLLPNEQKTICLKIKEKILDSKDPEIHLEGWNTKAAKFLLSNN